MTPAPPALHAQVVVVGGGLGGCAAAIAAAEAGADVLLTEQSDRVGGQVSSQLVSALDEHSGVEEFAGSASYAAFRSALRTGSGGDENPGGGWVSRLCVLPGVAQSVLEHALASAGVRVVTGVAPVSAQVSAGVVGSVTLGDGSRVEGEIFADATELGELLPMAGAPWTVGSEGPRWGERHALDAPDPQAMQAITWCALLENVPGAEFTPVPRPPDFARWRQHFSFEIDGWDGTPHRYRMFEAGPDGRPPFWTYRRLSREPDVMVLNWVSNDYADASLVHSPQRAAVESRLQTLGFVHWLQTEAPHDDGAGRGFRSLRLCPELAGTPDGLAAAPYVRESRRLRLSRPVTGTDLEPVRGHARARAVPDSVGVAHYSADLHPRVGEPATVYAPTAPFQLPLRALVAGEPSNLLAAAKNLGATQVAASAWRVHRGEWAVGEAAGTLAAYCVRIGVAPPTVRDSSGHLAALQRVLVARGVALAWTNDVGPEDELFAPTQLLVAAGGLGGDRLAGLELDPGGRVDTVERATLHQAAVRLAGADRLDQPAPSRTPRWRDLVAAYSPHLDLPGTTSPARRSYA